MPFKLKTTYKPKGDQPEAIKQLTEGIDQGVSAQTLLGVTGSGKTFTMANLVARVQRPTLIMSHNKTLAAQLYNEFKQFFPENAVEYFISYYDFYQPEAYISSTSTYIEKRILINEEIEKLRLRTVSSLLSGRKDVLVVASVACIYGMGDPDALNQHVLYLKVGDAIGLDQLLLKLVKRLYTRQEAPLRPGNFRVQGDYVDLFLAYQDYIYRFYFFGHQLERIQRINPATNKVIEELSQVVVYPAHVFVTSKELIERVRPEIEADLEKQLIYFRQIGKLEEAKRLEERTRLDLEMMQELGYCSGIENYSRYFDRRLPGQRPFCLFDYLPEDALLLIDESHVTIPQIRAMYGGDRARKTQLVDYGFRLPAAIDNRPLSFSEFEQLMPQTVFVSATPSVYEIQAAEGVVVTQEIRPTGLLDPTIDIQPSTHQIDHLLGEIKKRLIKKERVLITTITKKMAEKLSQYLSEAHIKARYMHSEIKTLERVALLDGLRKGVFDVLVGVNLLREGLDLPQVSLVAILDADKEGFLRNTRSLIQIIGRAARHLNGHVIMYADKRTPSMEEAITATQTRREKQKAYNQAHGIVPQSVQQTSYSLLEEEDIVDKIEKYQTDALASPEVLSDVPYADYTPAKIRKEIKLKERAMKKYANQMDYRSAKKVRDEIKALEKALNR